MKSTFVGCSINSYTLEKYLKENYNIDIDGVNTWNVELSPVDAFLQSEFHDSQDCIVLSISMMLHAVLLSDHISFSDTYKWVKYEAAAIRMMNRKEEPNPRKIYRLITSIARSAQFHSYIRSGYESASSDATDLFHPIVKRHHIKNIGFNKKKIENLLRFGIPLVMFISKDGRHYYRSQAVLVKGMRGYRGETGQQATLLEVFDGWSKETRFIDYSEIGAGSSIYYCWSKIQQSLY